jgi:hypothetical protein
MKNMSQLRDKLCVVFDELHQGKTKAKEAKELANLAGKIISSVSVELKACEVNKTNHNIAFLLSETK